MKSRNPNFGYVRTAQQISHAFGFEIDKDVVCRVLVQRYWLLRVTASCAIFVLTSFLPLVIAYAHANAGTPLRVQLLWTHQTQFAGYYFAETHSSHGRDATVIELVEGGPGINPFDRLIKGEADVAIGWLADALAARAKGADIVNVAQISGVREWRWCVARSREYAVQPILRAAR